jgi:hypothetical protein
MNTLVDFITRHGGSEYNIVHSLKLLGGDFSGSNISCVWYNDELILNTRLINYAKIFQSQDVKLLENYNSAQTYIFKEHGFTSRNLVTRFSNGIIHGTVESNYVGKDYNDIYKGFEDCRLVVWDGKLYAYGTRWDRTKERCGCICIYELNNNMQPINEIIVLPQNTNNCEKNWAAVEDKPFTFVYSHNPLNVIEVDRNGKCKLIKNNEVDKNITYQIKGSTPIVRFDEDRYLSLVHTNNYYEKNGIEYSDYLTAFVFYDNDLNIIKMSDWFVFKSPMCEFTCGLTIHGDDVYITYSQLDCTSHLLVTNKNTIENFINTHKNEIETEQNFWLYYTLAKKYEDERQYTSSSPLYNYALTKINNKHINEELKIECLIKTYSNIVKGAKEFKVKEMINELIVTLERYSELYPNCCEFYYLIAILFKISNNLNEYVRFKQLGDDKKVNLHSYFFKYFNPNYL